MWLRDDNCREIVQQGWSSTPGSGNWDGLLAKVKACSSTLESWNLTHFGHVQRRIKQNITALEALQCQPESAKSLSEEKQLLVETEEWLEREEILWRQRSRDIWLQEGDRNTRFFHMRASRRRERNTVGKLLKDDGQWTDNPAEIRSIASSYFESLFSSSSPSDLEYVLNCVEPCVQEDDNRFLLSEFTEHDITRALFQMHPSKAPGPDGLSPGFFQHFWDIVKMDVIGPCLKFLNENEPLPEQLNFTNIVLIPKCPKPKTMANLRPISLCNVIYKVLAKTLANRFKSVLSSVISPVQSAFLPNRLITDNFLIAFEVLHHMKVRKKRKRGWQAIKLDMSKAFDRVEWPYLEQIMRSLGFAEHWIQLIMACVTSVQYEVLLNGSEAGQVSPTRGIRQGDPLSPYLFILYAEGLTAMIHDAERRRLLHGIKICHRAPCISHLLFADDSFLFLRATETEAQNLKDILQKYELMSGQKVNLCKSAISFSSSVHSSIRRCITDILGMEEIEHQGQYLGFPAYVGRSRSAAFSNLKSKFWARINEWRAQPLSRAGREVLIKFVLQALPTYVMGLFKLPKTLCTDLERIMNRYWWGGGEEEHKIHWLEWRRLAISKKHGGLGFRALHEFNMAMLGKQGWRLMTNPDSLAAQLLKAKYFPRTNFLHAVLKPGCSLTWRSICSSKELLSRGCRRLLGDGRSTEIWGDPWLPGNSEFYLQSPRPPNYELRYVSDLIDDSSHAWNRDLIQNTFSSYEAHLIISLPISWEQREDRWTWSLTRHGTYSVRSGYHCAMNMQRDMGVPSSSNASFGGNKKKHILVELECPVCGSAMESVAHCLLFCSVARAVWHGSSLSLRVSEFPSSSFADFFDAMCTELGKEQLELLCILSWRIWSSRNEAHWNGRRAHPQQIIEGGVNYLMNYQRAQQSMGRGSGVVQVHGETKWKPPDEQTIKINVDGAVAEQRKVFGMGAVARDHCGEVLATMACQGRDVAAAEIVEACSIRRALQWAQELNLGRIIIETDCASIVTALSNNVALNSDLGNVLSDCKLLMSSFLHCRVKHVRRTGNAVAHEVKSESDIERELEFFEDPDYIPPPTPCSESYETEEMSFEETLSIGGNEELRMLEYSDISIEGESSGSERTEGGVGRNEVVEVGAKEVPVNILEVGDRSDKCYDSGANIVSKVKGYESELWSRDSLSYLVESYEISSRVLIRLVGVKERACSTPKDHWMLVYAHYLAAGLRFPLPDLLDRGDAEVEFLSTWRAKKANQNKYSLNSDEEEEVEKLVRREGDIIDIMFLTNSDVIEAAELYGPSALSEGVLVSCVIAAGGVAIPKKPRKKSQALEKAVPGKGDGYLGKEMDTWERRWAPGERAVVKHRTPSYRGSGAKGDGVVEFVPQPTPVELDPDLKEIEVPAFGKGKAFVHAPSLHSSIFGSKNFSTVKNFINAYMPEMDRREAEGRSLAAWIDLSCEACSGAQEFLELVKERNSLQKERDELLKKNGEMKRELDIVEHIGNFINSSTFDNIVNLYWLPTAILAFIDCKKKVKTEYLEVDITKITFGEQEEGVEKNDESLSADFRPQVKLRWDHDEEGHIVFPPNFDFEFVAVEEEEGEVEGVEVEKS
ncbi:hypothetical protein SLEP1_g2954 [Rubroshorea leprosula]|uniref:Reverse transcriptase domain-containing protein n=1 Tax=Rubroshorea leprosula TaxID=152421 RepID=A0AAV5HPM1_9ROSI|nr:hypothetical protein SLEP1_g2954 [Rubroshorea leprosula]